MVDRAKSSDDCPFSNRDVASQGCGVGQDDVIADKAIVRDVGVSHDQGMTTYASNAATLHGAPIDGDKLANLVVVADLEPRGFAGVGDVLRRQPNRREGIETIVR